MRAATVLAALALCATTAGCRHRPTEKDQRAAETHYDLGVIEANKGNIQLAMREYQAALELDESFPEAHNAIGVLLHNSYKRMEEAIRHYKRALEIKPDFSAAKVNLGNVYLDTGKYDEAITLYDQVLNDMLYPTPHDAHSNRGWALYKKGDVRGGMEGIQTAITLNPKFCQGYRNLGLINQELGNTEAACNDFRRYRESCPADGEAYYREGVCLAKLGKTEEALRSFVGCQAKDAPQAMKDECRSYQERMQ